MWDFPSGSVVKNPPAMQEPQEMWVQYLGREDPVEEGMATHSNIFPWRIPWTEEPGGLHSIDLRRVGHDLSNLAAAAALSLYLYTEYIEISQKSFSRNLLCS